MSPDQFDALEAALKAAEPRKRPSDLAREVADKLRATPEASDIVQSVASLASAQAEIGTKMDALATDVSNSNDVTLEPSERVLLRDRLIRLLAVEPLVVTGKALDVLHEDQRTFHSVRVLTDLRPVFYDEATQPPAAIAVRHVLKISYHEGDQFREFYVSLEERDIQMVKDAIRRAEDKSASLVSALRPSRLRVLQEGKK
jgi:hypothetical protein